jgi:hypothetical protein
LEGNFLLSKRSFTIRRFREDGVKEMVWAEQATDCGTFFTDASF